MVANMQTYLGTGGASGPGGPVVFFFVNANLGL